jgi:membrane protein DedA with SNARE-associated domain
MPPPFPLTAFQLTCGALDFDRRRFFLVFGVARLVRFAAVALLARHFGSHVTEMLQWHWLQTAGSAVTLVGLAATTVMSAVLWSRTRPLLA